MSYAGRMAMGGILLLAPFLYSSGCSKPEPIERIAIESAYQDSEILARQKDICNWKPVLGSDAAFCVKDPVLGEMVVVVKGYDSREGDGCAPNTPDVAATLTMKKEEGSDKYRIAQYSLMFDNDKVKDCLADIEYVFFEDGRFNKMEYEEGTQPDMLAAAKYQKSLKNDLRLGGEEKGNLETILNLKTKSPQMMHFLLSR